MTFTAAKSGPELESAKKDTGGIHIQKANTSEGLLRRKWPPDSMMPVNNVQLLLRFPPSVCCLSILSQWLWCCGRGWPAAVVVVLVVDGCLALERVVLLLGCVRPLKVALLRTREEDDDRRAAVRWI